MVRLTVPSNCLGFEMPDGTKYNNRGGTVSVDDPRHEAAIRTSLQNTLGLIGKGGIVFAGTGITCCRRTLWPWEDHCPRCGKEYLANGAEEAEAARPA